jgi:hypothetical protein
MTGAAIRQRRDKTLGLLRFFIVSNPKYRELIPPDYYDPEAQ